MLDALTGKECVALTWGGGRHVVYDPGLQPEQTDVMLLYFVEGHALCTRNTKDDSCVLSPIENPYIVGFAIEQYMHWLSDNGDFALGKAMAPGSVEDPPPRRKKCPQCDGQGTWFDTHNKPTYGVHSEGPNIVDRCQACGGSCFVDDVL